MNRLHHLPPQTSGRKTKITTGLFAYFSVFPATFLLLVLLFIPAMMVIVVSLTDWQFGASTLRFIGLGNFNTLFSDPIFWKALSNTLLYVLMVVPGTLILGLFVALLIEASPGLRGFYRAIHFLPVMSTMSAMAIVWGSMLHPTIGLVNRMLSVFGVTGPNWLRDEDTVLIVIAIIGIWQNFGFAMVLFVSGLKAIPEDLYHAASIDGADGVIDRLRTVTLPMLGPVMLFVSVITAARSFEVFDSVRVLTQGGPNYASEVLLNRLYTESFDYLRTGYGAALTVVYLLMVIGLTLGQSKVLERRVHYS